FLSLLVELLVGYPDRLVRAIGHPVIWIGRLIGSLDRRLNRPEDTPRRRRAMGVLTLCLLIAIAGGVAWWIERLLLSLTFGIVGIAVLASSLLAQRSLASHVAAVAAALENGGLAEGRKAVSMIVGRDPDRLDE